MWGYCLLRGPSPSCGRRRGPTAGSRIAPRASSRARRRFVEGLRAPLGLAACCGGCAGATPGPVRHPRPRARDQRAKPDPDRGRAGGRPALSSPEPPGWRAHMLPGSRMGTGVATYVIALSIVLASLLVGRAVMLLLGRRQASFLEGAVGIATLVLVCTRRDPPAGRGDGVAGWPPASSSSARWSSWSTRREAILGPAVGVALPVALIASACSPRCRSSPAARSGSRASASTTTWRCTWSTPNTCSTTAARSRRRSSTGTRSGPTAWSRTVVNLFGTEPLHGWLGLLVAAPVLTAITSLAVLRELPAGRRILAAALVVGRLPERLGARDRRASRSCSRGCS